jgi:hypothetical protein
MESLKAVLQLITAKGITLTKDEQNAISHAFSTKGKTKGYLKANCPPGLSGAAWQAIQPNTFKISFCRCLFFSDTEKELFTKLADIKFPKDLDYDRNLLEKCGAW